MVPIPGSQGTVDLTGFMTEDQVGLPPFAIDRYEVTNRQFKEFIDAGGYTNRELWKHAMRQRRPGALVGRGHGAVSRFERTPGALDVGTGRLPHGPGRSSGHRVSWYEAAAYAEFRRASLPTIYHWARAALAYTRPAPIRGLIIQASNFAGQGPVAVGSTGALGPFGAYDMAGNVREWCFNASGSHRWILGGAWNDHDYMSVDAVCPAAARPIGDERLQARPLRRGEPGGRTVETARGLPPGLPRRQTGLG